MSERAMTYRCQVATDDSGERLTIEVMDYIDASGGDWGVSANEVINALNGSKGANEIQVNIHSGGGDLFEAMAIYNRLKASTAKVHVKIDGIAASAASLIAMAGDTIEMPENAWLMIHQPWSMAVGNASDMREQADFLDRNTEMLVDVYAERSGKDRDDVREWVMDETWFNGPEALAAGLVDNMTEAVSVAASSSISDFSKTPQALAPVATTHKEPTMATLNVADIRNACPGADSDFVLAHVENGSDIQAVQSDWMNNLAARLENREQELVDLKAAHGEELEAVKAELNAKLDEAVSAKAEAEEKLAAVVAGVSEDETPAADDGGEVVKRTFAQHVAGK